MADARGLTRKMERVESLVVSLEGCSDPQVRQSARELVATLMEFHGAAIARMFEILAERGVTPEVIDALGVDPVAGSLMLMYGLHPADLETRVNAALAQVRPTLRRHRGDVVLLGIQDGKVRLRLQGTCNGCPASTTTFRNLIEGAIQERAPEIDSILVEGMAVP